jgi:hypothetical protein
MHHYAVNHYRFGDIALIARVPSDILDPPHIGFYTCHTSHLSKRCRTSLDTD